MSRQRIIFPGPLLQQLRIEKGFFAPTDLATAAQLELKTISRIERVNNWNVNPSTFATIANALGIDPGQLLDRINAYLKGSPIQQKPAALVAVSKLPAFDQDMMMGSLLSDVGMAAQESAAVKDQLKMVLAAYALMANVDPEIKSTLISVRKFGRSSGLLRLIERDLDTAGAHLRHLHLKRAAVSLIMGDTTRAADSIAKVITAAPADAEAMILSAQIDRLRGKLDMAEQTYRQVLRITDEGSEQIDALSGLGLIGRDRGDLLEARQQHEMALAMAMKLGQPHHQADQHRYLGVICRRQTLKEASEDQRGRKETFAKTRAHYGRALRLYRSIPDRIGIADTCDHIGVLYLTTGRARVAQRWHERALEMNRRLRRRSGIAFAMGNLVIAMGQQGKFDAAIQFARGALRNYGKIGWPEHIARAHANLAECYTRLERVQPGSRHWKLAKEMFSQLGMIEQANACDVCLQKLLGHAVRDPYMA